jgi:hypothetical protein
LPLRHQSIRYPSYPNESIRAIKLNATRPCTSDLIAEKIIEEIPIDDGRHPLLNLLCQAVLSTRQVNNIPKELHDEHKAFEEYKLGTRYRRSFAPAHCIREWFGDRCCPLNLLEQSQKHWLLVLAREH